MINRKLEIPKKLKSKLAKSLKRNNLPKEEEKPEFVLTQMTFSGGMTLNMGDYESFKADVSITLKTTKEYPTKEEKAESIKRMQKEGWDLVDEIIRPKLVSAKEAKRKRDLNGKY